MMHGEAGAIEDADNFLDAPGEEATEEDDGEGEGDELMWEGWRKLPCMDSASWVAMRACMAGGWCLKWCRKDSTHTSGIHLLQLLLSFSLFSKCNHAVMPPA